MIGHFEDFMMLSGVSAYRSEGFRDEIGILRIVLPGVEATASRMFEP